MNRLLKFSRRSTPSTQIGQVPDIYPYYDADGVPASSANVFSPSTKAARSVLASAVDYDSSPNPPPTVNGVRRRDRKDRQEKRERSGLFRRDRRGPASAARATQQAAAAAVLHNRAIYSEDEEDYFDVTSSPTPWEGTNEGTPPGDRFVFQFRKRPTEADRNSTVDGGSDSYFGATQYDDDPVSRNSEFVTRPGELALLRLIRSTLGDRAGDLTHTLLNRTPIMSQSSYEYRLHQGTEDSDLQIINRDMNDGRAYKVGRKMEGGAWCNLLLGQTWSTKPGKRQRHELTYIRESCTCIRCGVQDAIISQEISKIPSEGSQSGSQSGSSSSRNDLMSQSSSRRTPVHSAMANFVVSQTLPSVADLSHIGGVSSWRELEIGTIVRLNSRSSAKLKFTDDVRSLFGNLAYTGPVGHEEIYRKVTTIGVDYYLYNKGKKERRVYIQGDLVRLPINVGVVKLGTQPMYMDDLGATFVLYRQQIMSIYVGEVVLEGNSIGSYVSLTTLEARGLR